MDLILNTFGTCLSRENEQFIVQHKDGKQSISPDAIKSISISKGAQITSDAALLAIEHQIDVMFVDNVGKPVGRLWSIKYGSISTIRRKQLDFTFSKEAVKWIKEIIMQKIENQIALIVSVAPPGEKSISDIKPILNRLNDYRKKSSTLDGEIVSDIASSLRGWEGASSRIYFEYISSILPESYKYETRTQHPAADTFNALLNYGYGILYGKIEGAMIKAGIDPYIGVFHRDDYNRPVLVFDVIELFRVWIDFVVIHLCMQEVITDECYSVNKDGSYWLETLGKRILIQSVNDYMEEIVSFAGNQRKRSTHIELYTQSLAQKFLNLKEAKQ